MAKWGADPEAAGVPRGAWDPVATGYKDRKIAEIEASRGVTVASLDVVKTVADGLFGAAKANPLMGILAAAVVTDLLHQARVIRDGTAMLIFRTIEVAVAIDLSAQGINAFADLVGSINPFGKGAPSNASSTSIITPTPTTLIENPPPAMAPPPPPPGAYGLSALLPTVGRRGRSYG